jgi:hypothetical protein
VDATRPCCALCSVYQRTRTRHGARDFGWWRLDKQRTSEESSHSSDRRFDRFASCLPACPANVCRSTVVSRWRSSPVVGPAQACPRKSEPPSTHASEARPVPAKCGQRQRVGGPGRAAGRAWTPVRVRQRKRGGGRVATAQGREDFTVFYFGGVRLHVD